MFSRLKISAKLLFLVLVSILGFVIISSFALDLLRSYMISERTTKAHDMAIVGRETVDHIYKSMIEGAYDEATAKKLAQQTLSDMRFSDGGYYYIYTTEGDTILLPSQPEIEGTNRYNLQDTNGVYIIRELVKSAQNNGTPVFYKYPRFRSVKAVDKISSALPFAPWDWIIGTGVYIDDIDAAFQTAAIRFSFILAPIIFLVVTIHRLLAQSISRSLVRLSGVAERLAAEDYSVDVIESGRDDEVGTLERSIRILRDSARRAATLRQEQIIALTESEEKLRSIFESMAEGVIIQLADGDMFASNTSAEKILGYSRKQMESPLSSLNWHPVHEDGSPFPIETHPITISLHTGETINNTVMGFPHQDGSLVWILINSAPMIRPGETKPYAAVSTFTDITARKQTEDEVRKLNAGLEQRVKERTAEIESFSYSVSHDLRAPLRAIDGFSKMLLESYAEKLDDEGKRLLHVVRDNTVRMAKLIDDILAFSRVGRAELTQQQVDMQELAKAIVEDITPSCTGRDVKIEIGTLPPAHGDATMLRQVWINLLTNAIKFTAPKAHAVISLGAYSEESETVYFVKDNGVGFDMRYVGKLFGMFQRLHSTDEFEGTGVGLAIVKLIITRHGGRVWAESKLNEETTFFFALPAILPSAPIA